MHSKSTMTASVGCCIVAFYGLDSNVFGATWAHSLEHHTENNGINLG